MASAILSGDSVTGVTVMKINEVMDSGPIIASRETPIGPHENAEELTSRLFRMGALLLVEVLPKWAEGEERARPQDESQATFTRHLSREDGEIDWGTGRGTDRQASPRLHAVARLLYAKGGQAAQDHRGVRLAAGSRDTVATGSGCVAAGHRHRE